MLILLSFAAVIGATATVAALAPVLGLSALLLAPFGGSAGAVLAALAVLRLSRPYPGEQMDEAVHELRAVGDRMKRRSPPEQFSESEAA